jgi:hypothetical protein
VAAPEPFASFSGFCILGISVPFAKQLLPMIFHQIFPSIE